MLGRHGVLSTSIIGTGKCRGAAMRQIESYNYRAKARSRSASRGSSKTALTFREATSELLNKSKSFREAISEILNEKDKLKTKSRSWALLAEKRAASAQDTSYSEDKNKFRHQSHPQKITGKVRTRLSHPQSHHFEFEPPRTARVKSLRLDKDLGCESTETEQQRQNRKMKRQLQQKVTYANRGVNKHRARAITSLGIVPSLPKDRSKVSTRPRRRSKVLKMTEMDRNLHHRKVKMKAKNLKTTNGSPSTWGDLRLGADPTENPQKRVD